MTRNITIPQDKLTDFCRRHHIRRLSLFGSVPRHGFGPDSDVDVLVELEPGRKAGLNTPGCLSRYIRDRTSAEAELQYGAP